MNFRVGDSVTWVTQSHGHTYTKVGRVICLVAAGKNPFHRITTQENGEKCYHLPNFGPVIPCKKTVYGGGKARHSVSYIVQADDRYYWPLAEKLQAYDGPAHAPVEPDSQAH